MTQRRRDLIEFEARLRMMTDEPPIKLFLDFIDGMPPAARDEALERQKKVMDATEALGRILGNILSSEEATTRLREMAAKGSGAKS